LQTRGVERDGYTSFLLYTGLHAGTHLDAPLHFLRDGAMVKELPLDTFMGRGCLIDVRGEVEVGFKPEYESLIKTNDIVLVWTGHSAKYGTDAYYEEHPVLKEELADFLIAMGVKIVGFDLPSPDTPPFAIHRKLLGAGIPIVENLTNLEELAGFSGFEVMAFPLKISAEGSPVRVVAKAT
jgi:kynurenine formamidase